MCLEHGVLEAVCTKCNPKLIPIFKAKGDWCAEHEFPESFCPLCHPDLGGRPAVDVSDVSTDGAPADGTRIRFKTLETARQAGIQTVKAVDGSDEGAVFATAKIVGDPARMARVNVTAPGVIRSLRACVRSPNDEPHAARRAAKPKTGTECRTTKEDFSHRL